MIALISYVNHDLMGIYPVFENFGNFGNFMGIYPRIYKVDFRLRPPVDENQDIIFYIPTT